MTKPAAPEKRPYLGREDRRKHLLIAASEIVEHSGWSALSMSALAESTGVSRQLIYQHFENLESLLSATAWTIFIDTIEGTRAAIANHPEDVRMAVRDAMLVSLDMPVGRGDALWQMIAGMNFGMPELEAIRNGIRDMILAMWTPPIRKAKGLNEAQARGQIWMLVMAFWGIRNLIRDGIVTRKQGIEEYERVLTSMLDDLVV